VTLKQSLAAIERSAARHDRDVKAIRRLIKECKRLGAAMRRDQQAFEAACQKANKKRK
jgi:hypothetical protein